MMDARNSPRTTQHEAFQDRVTHRGNGRLLVRSHQGTLTFVVRTNSPHKTLTFGRIGITLPPVSITAESPEPLRPRTLAKSSLSRTESVLGGLRAIASNLRHSLFRQAAVPIERIGMTSGGAPKLRRSSAEHLAGEFAKLLIRLLT
jgi:hypothetical protein